MSLLWYRDPRAPPFRVAHDSDPTLLQACLSYLKEKKKAYAKSSSSTKGSNANSAVAALSADTLGVFFTVMQANIKYVDIFVTSLV